MQGPGLEFEKQINFFGSHLDPLFKEGLLGIETPHITFKKR